MTEVRFHHLERRRIDQALPRLIERAREECRRVLVRASSDEMVAALNERLWTYDDASFLPHGAAGDGDPTTQPIFLTCEAGIPTPRRCWSGLPGADADESDDAFDLVVLLFDGRDEAALNEARSEWRRLKDEGRPISYWRESDEGSWERARSVSGQSAGACVGQRSAGRPQAISQIQARRETKCSREGKSKGKGRKSKGAEEMARHLVLGCGF